MDYFLAVFSNRNETIDFANKLKRYRVPHAVISTPKEVGQSCGVSVKISVNGFEYALRIFNQQYYLTFSAFYAVTKSPRGQYFYERISTQFRR